MPITGQDARRCMGLQRLISGINWGDDQGRRFVGRFGAVIRFVRKIEDVFDGKRRHSFSETSVVLRSDHAEPVLLHKSDGKVAVSLSSQI